MGLSKREMSAATSRARVATSTFRACVAFGVVLGSMLVRASRRKCLGDPNDLEKSEDCGSVGGHGNQHVRLRRAQIDGIGTICPAAQANTLLRTGQIFFDELQRARSLQASSASFFPTKKLRSRRRCQQSWRDSRCSLWTIPWTGARTSLRISSEPTCHAAPSGRRGCAFQAGELFWEGGSAPPPRPLEAPETGIARRSLDCDRVRHRSALLPLASHPTAFGM